MGVITDEKVVISSDEMEEFESNTEGTRGIRTLCQLANLLNYKDVLQTGFHPGEFGKGSYCIGDLIEMLKDNPFLVEALVEQIKDNFLEVNESKYYDEDEELPKEIQKKIKKYCELHKDEYIEAGQEINLTKLAEDIADEYGIFINEDSEIHPDVFEIVSDYCSNEDEDEE